MSHITSFLSLVAALLYVSVTSALAGQSTPVTPAVVTLYLRADSHSPALGTATLNEALRQHSQPHHEEALALERWWQTEQKFTLQGYVGNNNLLKDLSIRPESPIYQEASLESPILIQWQKGDHAEYGDVQGRFTQVTVTRTQPVYYQVPAAPVAETPAVAVTPVAVAVKVVAEEVAPKPDGDPIAPPIASYRFLSELPENPKQIRYFVGTFRPYRGVVRDLKKHPFEIIGGDRRRIAYINADKVTATEPLDRLFHKRVLITGTVKKIEKSNHYLIDAISIRPREN